MPELTPQDKRRIYEEEEYRAKVRAELNSGKKVVEKDDSPKSCLIVFIFTFGVLFVLSLYFSILKGPSTSSSTSSSSSYDSSSYSSTPSPTSTGSTSSQNREVILDTSKDYRPILCERFEDNDRLYQANKQGDVSLAEGLALADKVFMVENGTPATEISRQGLYVQVTIQSGTYKGRTGWVLKTNVK